MRKTKKDEIHGVKIAIVNFEENQNFLQQEQY